MIWHHPTYYRKLREERKASAEKKATSLKPQATSYKPNDLLDSENSERFVESAKPKAKRDST